MTAPEPLEDPVFAPRFENKVQRCEHQFRQVSRDREANVEREKRILQSQGGLDFLASVERIGRCV